MSLHIALVIVLFGGVKSEESCEQSNDASEKTGECVDWKNSGRKSKFMLNMKQGQIWTRHTLRTCGGTKLRGGWRRTAGPIT